jgi:predicted Fe-S protein YdhL (DUF1289 family)
MSADIDKPPPVPSPCVRNCCLDENDVCLGCNRSLTEICEWTKSSDDEKRQILARCRLRAEGRKSGQPAGPGKPG